MDLSRAFDCIPHDLLTGHVHLKKGKLCDSDILKFAKN